ncbi:MAG: (2Fe-2S)-binding protein [bacterium]|nr:(2Fe-2S)-binding protein [bacterium]
MSSRKTIRFRLNGETKEFTITAGESLLDLLRRSGYSGTKRGCEDGACGSCTVIMNGSAINSCITFAFQAHDRKVRTIESVGEYDRPDPFQTAMVEEAGVQCGFCIPGIIMSVKAMLDEVPNPTEQEIFEHLDGNYCRCTGYEKIEDALHRTIAETSGEKPQWTR